MKWNSWKIDLPITHGYTTRTSFKNKAIRVTYQTWRAILVRCYCKTSKDYPQWGGRGIKVCREWKSSFPAFLKDMGLKPEWAHSLDRKNNNRGYSKSNCRWATRSQQMRNTRRSTYISFNNKRQSIYDWCKELGICRGTLHWRLYFWPKKKALTQALKPYRRKKC